MRQIQQDVIQALRDRRNFRAGNGRDRIEWKGKNFKVYLWDNLIAEGNVKARDIRVSDCGYATATTTSRLNAVFAGLDIPMAVCIRNKQVRFSVEGQPLIGGPIPYTVGEYIVHINKEA